MLNMVLALLIYTAGSNPVYCTASTIAVPANRQVRYIGDGIIRLRTLRFSQSCVNDMQLCVRARARGCVRVYVQIHVCACLTTFDVSF
jgi:hypothetical protein